MRTVCIGLSVAFIADDHWRWSPVLGGMLLAFAFASGDEYVINRAHEELPLMGVEEEEEHDS
jgi:hypothetical protein